jgi:hypothetical protein
VVDLRRASGDSRMTAWLRRASGWHGDLVRLIDVLECVQMKEREAAGGPRAELGFGLAMVRSSCCESHGVKWSGRCARARQRG